MSKLVKVKALKADDINNWKTLTLRHIEIVDF